MNLKLSFPNVSPVQVTKNSKFGDFVGKKLFLIDQPEKKYCQVTKKLPISSPAMDMQSKSLRYSTF